VSTVIYGNIRKDSMKLNDGNEEKANYQTQTEWANHIYDALALSLDSIEHVHLEHTKVMASPQTLQSVLEDKNHKEHSCLISMALNCVNMVYTVREAAQRGLCLVVGQKESALAGQPKSEETKPAPAKPNHPKCKSAAKPGRYPIIHGKVFELLSEHRNN
jgi:hypothetical protein